MAEDAQSFNVSCFEHVFSVEMENAHLNDEQQSIIDYINNIVSGLYFIKGTLGNIKMFFV
jgi:hypothetical protein